jgi:hypothetical protein
MDRIGNVRKAVEFGGPERIPIELVDVPGVYDDYGTIDPEGVDKGFQPLGDFDVVQATYHWVFRDLGEDREGNVLREDEWGCRQKIPKNGEYAYFVLNNPLRNWDDLGAYRFPDPSVADGWFSSMARSLKRYPGKFVNAFIDPGVTLVALNLRGYEELLVDYHTGFDRVRYLFDAVWDFQKELVRKWKRAGAHAVSLYEEWATQDRTYVSPEWWRERVKPFYRKAFDFIHGEGMYAGMGLDGYVLPILDDLKEIGLDILDNRQPVLLGVENLAKAGGGRICVKASCDMQLSLPRKSPGEVEREAAELANRLGRERNGGFIGLVFKWERIRIPAENVLASYRGFRGPGTARRDR